MAGSALGVPLPGSELSLPGLAGPCWCNESGTGRVPIRLGPIPLRQSRVVESGHRTARSGSPDRGPGGRGIAALPGMGTRRNLAEIVKADGDQLVRLPEGFRLKGDTVSIRAPGRGHRPGTGQDCDVATGVLRSDPHRGPGIRWFTHPGIIAGLQATPGPCSPSWPSMMTGYPAMPSISTTPRPSTAATRLEVPSRKVISSRRSLRFQTSTARAVGNHRRRRGPRPRRRALPSVGAGFPASRRKARSAIPESGGSSGGGWPAAVPAAPCRGGGRAHRPGIRIGEEGHPVPGQLIGNLEGDSQPRNRLKGLSSPT